MELYLQLGYGMMAHCRHLLERWEEATVILSPRDLTRKQIQHFGSEIVKCGGRNLLDPQFFEPRATHHRLVNHDYWPDDFATSMLDGGSALVDLLQRLLALNDSACADRFVVPGLYGERVDDDWLAVQSTVIDEAANLVTDRPRIATLCLSAEALRFEDQIEMALNAAEAWDVGGVYIVPEHPATQYLVDDSMWLGNLLILCAGLKLQDKDVLLGYGSHQMLCLATARVDAIASGTWLNVRSFAPEKFHERQPGDIKRKAKWYYCPQALSEFKVPFLDIAYRDGALDSLRPDVDLGSDYADVLFSGAQPTSTDYSEQQSYRHYLQCLHRQCSLASRGSYRETFEAHLALLDDAQAEIDQLHRLGVREQDRDFGNFIDVNRSALSALHAARGFVLERVWQGSS